MSGSKSESSSQQQSTANSQNIGFGGSQNVAGSEQGSTSEAQNRTFIDPNQSPFLQNLFQQGSNLAGQQGQQGSEFGNFQSAAMGALLGMFQPSGQANPFLNQQIQQGQQMINENLQQNILPSVGSAAAGAGQLGGGRQGVAQGIALRDANRQSSDFAQNLIGQDFQGQQQRALQALGQAGNIGGLAFQPLQNLRSILGGSTVLSEGSSLADSFGSSFNESKSENFSQGSSQAQSSGASDSKSASAGFM